MMHLNSKAQDLSIYIRGYIKIITDQGAIEKSYSLSPSQRRVLSRSINIKRII